MVEVKVFKMSDGAEIVCELVKRIDSNEIVVRNCMEIRRFQSPVNPTKIVYNFTPWMSALRKDQKITLRTSHILGSSGDLTKDDIDLYVSIVNAHFDVPKDEVYNDSADIDVGRIFVDGNPTMH